MTKKELIEQLKDVPDNAIIMKTEELEDDCLYYEGYGLTFAVFDFTDGRKFSKRPLEFKSMKEKSEANAVII